MKMIIDGDQISYNCLQYLRKLNSTNIICPVSGDIIFSNFTPNEICKILNKIGPIKNNNDIGVYKEIEDEIFLEYSDGEIILISKDSD